MESTELDGIEACESEIVISSLPVAYKLELHRMIALAAYYRAEKDGFRCPPIEYWLAAESEIQKFPC